MTTWFNLRWTNADHLLQQKWIAERGKDVEFIDESIPDPLADPLPALIPYVIDDDVCNQSIKRKRTTKRKQFSKIERETIFFIRHKTCASCGDKNERVLQIDHVDGNPCNNELYNLQLLCYECHKLKHRKKAPIDR